jgi:hypothetical protein
LAFCAVTIGLLYMYDLRRAKSRRLKLESGHDTAAENHLRELFMQFDTDGDKIEIDEVQRILAKITPTANLEELARQARALFVRADKDANDLIDFQEFHDAIVAHNNSASDDGMLNLGALIEMKENANIRDRASGRLFLVVFLLYPGLTNKIFEGLSCRMLANDWSVLHVDYRVHCESDQYFAVQFACTVLIFLWPIGVPVLVFVMLHRNYNLIKARDPETLQMFAFLLEDYKTDHYYWEAIELARKLFLSGLIAMFRRGSTAQTVLATVVAFAFFALTVRHQPFNVARLNQIKMFTEFQIFGILLSCVVLQTHDRALNGSFGGTDVFYYGVAQTILTLSLLPITIFSLASGLKNARNAKGHQDEPREIDAFDNPVAQTKNAGSDV